MMHLVAIARRLERLAAAPNGRSSRGSAGMSSRSLMRTTVIPPKQRQWRDTSIDRSRAPFTVRGHDISMTASIGIALSGAGDDERRQNAARC